MVRVALVRFRVAYVHTSDAVSEPPPPDVSVRVPFVQTSAARLPNVVKEREALIHTAVGIVERRDVEAVSTVAFVFELIVETAEVIAEASDELAFPTTVFVFELTEAVPAETADAIDDEAVEMSAFVFVTSDSTAKDPAVKVASVKLRVAYVQTSPAVKEPPLVSVLVPFVQTSAARVPNVVRDRAELFQTAVGIVEAIDVDAVKTVAFVFALIVEIAVATCEFVFVFTVEAIDEDAVAIAEARDEDAVLI